MMRRILSYSGGKDSTALYLLALEHGRPFLPVFADTGNEHPATYDYVRDLPRLTGGPDITWVRADFAEDIKRRRLAIARDTRVGRRKGRRVRWTNKAKRRALGVLHPTGIPFLDLCLLKGRFPSTRARFCSEELKHHPIFFQAILPALEAGKTVVSWQGVRADESPSRAALPRRERVGGGLINFRPILHWSVDDVFAIHRRHGIAPNPLYSMGCGRVGCMPCIHACKGEIFNIDLRFPYQVDRISEWEILVSLASKRGLSSFFAADKTPGPHQTDFRLPMPNIRDVVEWSKTSRGGRQYDALNLLTEPAACSSIYGLCE